MTPNHFWVGLSGGKMGQKLDEKNVRVTPLPIILEWYEGTKNRTAKGRLLWQSRFGLSIYLLVYNVYGKLILLLIRISHIWK